MSALSVSSPFSADSAVSSVERPLCTCGVHTACSRSRISLYNDAHRTSLYVQALAEVLYAVGCGVELSDEHHTHQPIIPYPPFLPPLGLIMPTPHSSLPLAPPPSPMPLPLTYPPFLPSANLLSPPSDPLSPMPSPLAIYPSRPSSPPQLFECV